MIIHDTITCQRIQTILALCDRACFFLQSIYLSSYLRFLNIAFGSLRELHYQLNLSKRLGFLPNEDSSLPAPRPSRQAGLIEPKVVETEKVLNGLIRALRDVL
jgi:four helix bundle protein